MALCIANNGKEKIIIKDKKTGEIIITIFPYKKLENKAGTVVYLGLLPEQICTNLARQG